jgi:hypothetical protein
MSKDEHCLLVLSWFLPTLDAVATTASRKEVQGSPDYQGCKNASEIF